MSDLIDRQAAIDALCSVCGVDCDKSKFVYDGKQEDQVILCPEHYVLTQLPSAQPERPKGKWIPHNEKKREYIGTVLVNVEYDYWLCDSCGYRVENGQPMHNFCPNCGRI